MKTNKPGRLGDLKQFVVTANGVDITNAVTTANIWQDILTPSWSAQLTVQDTVGLIKEVPLVQGCVVTLKVETELGNKLLDGTKTYSFILYKLSDHILQKSKHQAYVLHLVSKEFLINQNKRVSKHYSKTADQIVQDVISTHLGAGVTTDSSKKKVDVIIPNWSPFVSAQWLCKSAMQGAAADFVFFMKDEGQFQFTSVENMYSSYSGLTFIQRIADIRDNSGNIDEERIVAIKGYSLDHYDGMSNLVGGYFGSTTTHYNLIEKNWGEKPFTFGEDNGADGSTKGFTGSHFEGATKANISFVPLYDKLFGDSPNIYDNADEWSGSRKSSTMKLVQNRLFVQLPGGANYWQFIGMGCNVDLHSQEDLSGEEFDKYFKGKYLISAVHHYIEDDVYTVNLELVKKRLEKAMI